MSMITYDVAPTARAGAPAAAPARKSGFFARFVAAMIASRQKQAAHEIRRFGLLLPRELEQTGWKIDGRSEDSLPFVR